MRFTTTTAAIAASTAALTSASPCGSSSNTTIAAGDIFRILTIRSGSALQYGSLQASNRALYINTPSQNASCSSSTPTNYASFFLSTDGSLYLNTDGNPPQQLFVDRSGMGQGVIQYTTGAEQPGRNSERTGWAVDGNGDLTFKESGLQACPGRWGRVECLVGWERESGRE
ncbi:hypothetical protein N0V83_008528 [Neocucurbitaria cava]|uniref:Cell wall protein PhiA n=1 Tax=Neocucurbitaria cava TaxID=798079 RepID=A0A9W8Y298_9PLEO|nr:hypothetical protein N0V83_008528 [Neocucurbitaria cava]